ncbi:hypothetical protein SUGI_0723600 [Cryptomeria japonica]|nr:hypothetical protein SUGI_0723600 [Cryptomeria japonica]
MINIVDEGIENDADVPEVRRVALVSLSCIQNDENAKPNMAQVLLILEGKTEAQTPQIQTVIMNRHKDQEKTDSENDSIV